MRETTESRRRRVLLVPVESVSWQRAQAWSYTLGLAFEEGLTANGVECAVVPALEGFPPVSPRSWLYHAPRLLDGQTFDQAWIWLNDEGHDAVFFDWLARVAPVRVGVITQSLEYTAEECRETPDLLARRDRIDQQLRAMTHALAVDEYDAGAIRARLGMPSAWLPCSVPARVVAESAAVTGGSADTQAEANLSNLAARSHLSNTSNADANWPAQYDALQREMLRVLTAGAAGTATAALLERYVAALRTIRRGLFERSIASRRNRPVSVHPPSALKAYAALVIESMSAGVPVVSWDIPHRPANRALFVPDHEIRVFDRHDREAQERHLRELRLHPEMARAQAAAAREAVAQRHTIEARVARILAWIETGAANDDALSDIAAASPDAAGRAGDATPVHAVTSVTSSYDAASSHHATPACASAPLFLPEEYRRRDAGAVPAARRPSARSGGYDLAARLAAALDCTQIADIGGAEPASAIDLSSSTLLRVTVVSSTEQESPGITLDRDSLILSVGVLERQDAPADEAARLTHLVAHSRCGLIISAARDRWWGASHAGPPPPTDRCQEWTASEMAALLTAAGLDVVHQSPFPAAVDRRELTAVATIVVARALPSVDRARIRDAAASTLTAYLAERDAMSAPALAGALIGDVPSVTAVVADPAVPFAHVLLDDTLVGVYSNSPADDVTCWIQNLEPLDGAPLVLFGLGLGYHALTAAARPDCGRVFVVEPFDRMIAAARAVDATRDALDRQRIEVVRDWHGFSQLARRERLDLSHARFAEMPGYGRLADEAYTSFVTLFEAARAWGRAGLGSTVKPFDHSPGMSVVISTFNRPDAVGLLVEDLARQRPCGVPVEVLLVNDDGDAAGLAAIRDAAHASGLDLRLFDTHFAGYGLTLARNIGLRFARYDTTVFLDDDLRVAPDLLWQYRQAPGFIRAGRIDAGFDDVQFDARSVRRARPDPRAEMCGREARVLRPWNAYETFLWGGNCAVTTELGLALGGFDEIFLGEGEEDTDFGARAVRATHRPVAVPGAWAQHEGLDQTTRVWLGYATANRPGRSRALLADTARGAIVNGGISYWSGARWDAFSTSTPTSASTPAIQPRDQVTM